MIAFFWSPPCVITKKRKLKKLKLISCVHCLPCRIPLCIIFDQIRQGSEIWEFFHKTASPPNDLRIDPWDKGVFNVFFFNRECLLGLLFDDESVMWHFLRGGSINQDPAGPHTSYSCSVSRLCFPLTNLVKHPNHIWLFHIVDNISKNNNEEKTNSKLTFDKTEKQTNWIFNHVKQTLVYGILRKKHQFFKVIQNYSNCEKFSTLAGTSIQESNKATLESKP